MSEFYTKIRQKIRNNLSQIAAVILMFLFMFFYLYNHIVYTIQSGEGGVKYLRFFGGTVVTRFILKAFILCFPGINYSFITSEFSRWRMSSMF